MNIGDQHQQAGHLLTALEDAEFTGSLDFVGVVGRSSGDADDLGL